ncbi:MULTISPECIES: antiterminator Q family protein [Yersinia]|uniref:Phage antitermination protein n=2 Tax=Yersinia TaxID=629 RepID=A0AAI8ZU02_YERFR|nr:MULTISPECIES: antiterminator Q family protein [Yersinia]NIL25073.1 antitermination protein [Yersinia massiliensis]CFR14660.1 phage antitermination protein [Yersinia frederiksenii]
MRDISIVLERWGGWAASDNSGVDYSHIAAGFKGLLPSKSPSRLSCCDDDGIIIDSCVAKLKKIKPDEYELVVLHYLYNVSLRAIARKRKCSDGTVRKEMQTAQGFILGILYILDVKLDI